MQNFVRRPRRKRMKIEELKEAALAADESIKTT